MEENIGKAKAKPSSLAAKIIPVNHLIIGALYYNLTLWAESIKELVALEMMVIQFLWVGSIYGHSTP